MFKPKFVIYQHLENPLDYQRAPNPNTELSEGNEKAKKTLSELCVRIDKVLQSRIKEIKYPTTWEIVQPLPSGVTRRRMATRIDREFKELIKMVSETLSPSEKELLAKNKTVFFVMDQNIKMSDDGSNLIIAESESKNFTLPNPETKEQKENAWQGTDRPKNILMSGLVKKMNDAAEQYDRSNKKNQYVFMTMMKDYVSDFYNRLKPTEKVALCNESHQYTYRNQNVTLSLGATNFRLIYNS